MSYKPDYMNNYRWKTVDQITVTVPKGFKAQIQEFAKNHGFSMNGFILEAIKEEMREDFREKSDVVMEYNDGDFQVEVRKKKN